MAEEQAGIALGVSGTPAIVIDGELLGSASWEEIDAAIDATGDTETAILRCNSGYPAHPDEMDLRAIPMMHDRWKLPIGLISSTGGSVPLVGTRPASARVLKI